MASFPCRLCEIPDFPGGREMALIAESIVLADGEGCDSGLYRSRISACAACPDLLGGLTCAHCGCYAALRALYATKDCPHPRGSCWPPPRPRT